MKCVLLNSANHQAIKDVIFSGITYNLLIAIIENICGLALCNCDVSIFRSLKIQWNWLNDALAIGFNGETL